MTASGLELEQPVELIENIFVDAHPTARKAQLDGGKSTLMLFGVFTLTDVGV